MLQKARANLHIAATACAQTAKYCPSEAPSVCYSVNVPSGSSGDVFFQIQGPSSQQWLGLGQGGQMAGSNIFMVYADATGKNVTVSPRKGVGNVMPVYPSGTQITVLEGSGIANGTMTANVRCKFTNTKLTATKRLIFLQVSTAHHGLAVPWISLRVRAHGSGP